MKTKKVIRIIKQILISIGFLAVMYFFLMCAFKEQIGSFVFISYIMGASLIVTAWFMFLKHVVFVRIIPKENGHTRKQRFIEILKDFILSILFVLSVLSVACGLINQDSTIFIAGLFLFILFIVLLFIFASMTKHPKKEDFQKTFKPQEVKEEEKGKVAQLIFIFSFGAGWVILFKKVGDVATSVAAKWIFYILTVLFASALVFCFIILIRKTKKEIKKI